MSTIRGRQTTTLLGIGCLDTIRIEDELLGGNKTDLVIVNELTILNLVEHPLTVFQLELLHPKFRFRDFAIQIGLEQTA